VNKLKKEKFDKINSAKMNQKSNIDGETQAIFQAEANLQTFTEHM